MVWTTRSTVRVMVCVVWSVCAEARVRAASAVVRERRRMSKAGFWEECALDRLVWSVTVCWVRLDAGSVWQCVECGGYELFVVVNSVSAPFGKTTVADVSR